MSTAQLVFLPWLREGVGAELSAKDDSGAVLNAGTLEVGVRLNDKAVDVQHVRVLGPGDVVGIDGRQVIRTDPTPGSSSFEPSRFVSVELDSPSLPWLFTPAAASGDRLRPWLTLVVVERREGVTVLPEAQLRATVLRIRRPADPDEELPDPTEAWAWAHVQVAGADPTEEAIRHTVQTAPERVLSRLICPRKLRANAHYVACLVPTFAAGRDAGLGHAVDPDALIAPAWQLGDSEVTLPVYHAWEFSTGVDGDFATLVERLKGRPAPTGVGEAALDITAAGARSGTTEPIAGALRRPEADTSAAPPAAVRAKLAGLVAGDRDDVRPPVYGGLQTGATAVPVDHPGWLAELNLDPRWRAAAAYGAALVREDQETLVAAAWQQAGEVNEANALIERGRLAAAANESLVRRRIDPLPAQDLLEITAPTHERLSLGVARLSSMVAASDIPDVTFTAAYRRIARPGGPVARRESANRRMAEARGEKPQPQAVPAPVPKSAIPKTMAAAEKILAPLASAALALETVRAEAVAADAAGIDLGDTPVVPQAVELQTAVWEAMKVRVVDALEPRAKIAERLAARLATDDDAPAGVPVAASRPTPSKTRSRTTAKEPGQGNAAAKTTPSSTESAAETLTPRLAAPSFNLPLYDGLARISPDAVLPGAELVPAESVILLRSDPAFVAAFLAGFNTELARELVWRGYPVDTTATFARSFWDYRGRADRAAADVPPIAAWERAAPLTGIPTTPGGGDQLVLAVRGELLRRYPRTLIYAVRAKWTGAVGGARSAADETRPENLRQATFSGFIAPDLRFFGFDLDAEAARGGGKDPGWFFAFQEQATEARFGGTVPPLAKASSASVAIGTRQPPVRVLMHADALLAGTATQEG